MRLTHCHAPSTVMLCFVATAIASLSGPECALGFLSSQFDLQKLDGVRDLV